MSNDSTRFSNPIGEEGLHAASVFDDDDSGSRASAPVSRLESTDSSAQLQANARNVQKFVGDQSKQCMQTVHVATGERQVAR